MKYRHRSPGRELCRWAEIAPSSFYYKSHPGLRGMKPSTHTSKKGIMVDNAEVIEEIRQILGQDYCVYGYHIMTDELRGLGYHINPKKVYRLMDESKLLCGKRIVTKGKRNWVTFRRIRASRPMEYLCLDIKHVYVQGEGRWYYQMAIIDVYSRMIIGYLFQPNIRQNDVIGILRNLDLRFGLKGVIIRNDNGSQFIAHRVRQALQDMEARQEFTHVATPEENAYIEAFHSIQQRELMDRFTFSSYYDAKYHIEKYMYWYNHIRRHGKIGGITPVQKWAQSKSSLVRRPAYDHQRQNSESFEKWSKNNAAGNHFAATDQDKYLYIENDQKKVNLVANLFRKSVQKIGG